MRKELDKLVNYIDENLRASEDSGIGFIDPRNLRSRLMAKQNHIIYGRRGSGKTSLVNSLRGESKIYLIKINVEDLKDISFPNIIIHVLSEFLKRLEKQVLKDISWYQLLKKRAIKKVFDRLHSKISPLERKLSDPDNLNQSVRERSTNEASGGINAGHQGVVSVGVKENNIDEREVQSEVQINKLDIIRNILPSIKENLQELKQLTGKDKVIFLVFDDLYFFKRVEQPYFVDFFHRLAKDTHVFIKIATIKHRTRIYTQNESSYYGMEVGHDIQEIDLDYTLDRFGDLKSFMKELLIKACESVGINNDISNILSPNGFTQLCLASGGVPRDFLSLFVEVAQSSSQGTISKVDVTNTAIAMFPHKHESFESDSAEERDVLEDFFYKLKKEVVDKNRTNMFLVPNEELEEFSKTKQYIKELVDLRMVHLAHSNTSCAPSDGKRYSAYMIDIGSYNNSKQRNFKQIEPGIRDERSRQDDIRSALKLNLGRISSID